ncbi:MAG: hypothetical protein HYR71_00475, partial [Chloroflexi bacterium]|nr:hypothetical protein [Chloroflexota bacterium]
MNSRNSSSPRPVDPGAVITRKRLLFIILIAAVYGALGGSRHALAYSIMGTPWAGAPGITETVDEIMARERAAPLQPAEPRLGWRTLTGPRPSEQSPLALPDVPQTPPALPEETSSVTPASPQTLSTNFLGATLSGVNPTNSFPPDTMGAAGPTQFLVGVNGRIVTFNKTSGTTDSVLNTSMDNFFASVKSSSGGTFTSDPHVRYDRLSGRWIVIIIDVPGGTGAGPNRVLLATSNSGTISGSTGFTFYYFQQDQPTPPGDTGLFADYPTLGVDVNALYIGVNQFTSAGSFVNTTAFVVRKSSILSGGPIVVTAFRGLLDGNFYGPYTPQGVDNYDPNATQGYFIGVDAHFYGVLDVRRVSDPGGAPSLSGNLVVSTASTYD